MNWLTEWLMPMPHTSHWPMFWHGLVFWAIFSLVWAALWMGILHLIWWLEDREER